MNILDRILGKKKATPYKIIGLYRIEPTLETITKAAIYHDHPSLLDESGNYIDEIYWEYHTNLGLVEIQIFGEFKRADLDQFLQKDQAAYMEYYLNMEGNALISVQDAEQIEGRRVCFFLHIANPAVPFMIKGSKYRLPAFSELPARLVPFTHYLPVD